MERGRYEWSRFGFGLRGFATALAALTLGQAVAVPGSAAVTAETGAVSLRIETGMHIAPIRAISADREGRYAVTASEDKTARVWDVGTGRLLQVFRPPSGPGNDGKLFAVSMSPDGQLFAASGWSAGNNVYLVNRSNGEIVHRITGLPNVVTTLAFAPDGRHLAVGLWGNHGVRLFVSTNGWRSATEHAGDSEVGGDVHAMAWSPDGKRLVISAADATLRLFSLGQSGLEPLARSPATEREVPFGLAFSPDGKRLAVGSSNAARVLLLDSTNLKRLATIDADAAVTTGGLSAVAWSADGQRVYAAGTLRTQGGTFPLCIWRGGATCTIEAPLARNTITALNAQPNGHTLFSTADPTWGLFDAKGAVSRSNGPALSDYRNLRSQFRLSPDGRGVVVGLAAVTHGPDRATAFDLGTLAWVSPTRDWLGPTTKSGRTSVQNWFEQRQPTVNGRSLKLDDNELALSATVSRKGERIVIGSNFFVRCYDESGQELWRAAAPGSTWQVNISADMRWLVAGFSDGSLRWFRLEDGLEQIALLPHPDGRRWVAWSPQGYFATSVGGEDLVGWQVERGMARSGDFFPVSRFRAEYFRPELISEISLRGNLSTSLNSLSSKNPLAALAKGIPNQLPPSVRVVLPEDGQVAVSPARLKVSAQTPDDAPVTGLRARVNGLAVSLPQLSAMRDASGNFFELPIPLPPADADVMVFAENRHGVSPAAVVRLLRPPDVADVRAEAATAQVKPPQGALSAPASASPAADLRPILYVLAVGVSDYADKSIRLEYSAKDASDLAQVLKSQEGPLYRKVAVKLLTDKSAKRDDILDGLEWIRREMTARDVGVVFLAGHGVNDSDGVYYFMPHDTEVKRLKRTGVIFTEIRNTLVALPGKALFFVDTCHSGNVLGTGLRALPNDTTAIVNELSSAENGVIVFTATTGRQYAQESDAWGNGAFTKALIEGLGGKADMARSGRITHKMLDLYVSERVKRLTDGAQSPVTITPSGIPDFPLAITPDRNAR